jgi:hypothetical protein
MKLRYLLSLSLLIPVASIECGIPSRFIKTLSIPPMVQKTKRASTYAFNAKKADDSWQKVRSAFTNMGKAIDSELGSLRSSVKSLQSSIKKLQIFSGFSLALSIGSIAMHGQKAQK